MERDVGGPPAAVGIGRNGEGGRLLGSSPLQDGVDGRTKEGKGGCWGTSQGQAAETRVLERLVQER
jgi:hypothetical protein